MPIWINALGVGCMGWVYGYLLLYSLKRHHPPVTPNSIPTHEIVSIMAAFGAGGTIGVAFTLLEGVNYFGAYGIGFCAGVIANIALTRNLERKRVNNPQTNRQTTDE